MDLEIGAIVTGKVNGITKFGAFVSVAPGKSGLVHISEIANTYVSDVHDHLAEGQEVTVKVIGVDPAGKINLSIKAALPPPPPRAPREAFARQGGGASPRASAQSGPPAELTFEDKLKRFMQDSDNKISGLRQFTDKKSSRRHGK